MSFKKIVNWFLVAFWIVTFVVLAMGFSMVSMYMMVIGMLIHSLNCVLGDKL
ncbi:hypothetical protein [Fructilactobacillus fructivorans]|uniref:Uncharacterized protein n=1 Tax=Fructilactobacillus fructivorans TaxID=1614 RepID=A0A0C1Q3E7_9LACO|nr:hypothetical protein [Fructilactobacillus fructivorans]KID42403.1 hypothetical protein LfDm3_0332 [Fructilactobacillus fructivorans]